MHFAISTFAVNPPVVRCSCGDKVVCDRPGKWAEHVTTGANGEFFPWHDVEEVE